MNTFWGSHVWADTSIMSHHCHFLFYGENIYSPSNFQVYNTVLLTLATVLHTRSPDSSSGNSKSAPLWATSPCGHVGCLWGSCYSVWVWLFWVSHMWYVELFLGDLVFSSFGYNPEVRLLGHMVVLFFIFCGPSIVFSIVAVLADTATNSAQGSLFPISSPPLTIFFFWRQLF